MSHTKKFPGRHPLNKHKVINNDKQNEMANRQSVASIATITVSTKSSNWKAITPVATLETSIKELKTQAALADKMQMSSALEMLELSIWKCFLRFSEGKNVLQKLAVVTWAWNQEMWVPKAGYLICSYAYWVNSLTFSSLYVHISRVITAIPNL